MPQRGNARSKGLGFCFSPHEICDHGVGLFTKAVAPVLDRFAELSEHIRAARSGKRVVRSAQLRSFFKDLSRSNSSQGADCFPWVRHPHNRRIALE